MIPIDDRRHGPWGDIIFHAGNGSQLGGVLRLD
jgi:hypothetical protein